LRKKKLGICPTLLAGMNRGGHSIPIIYDTKDIRALTPRDCFMLQGFPADYVLPPTVSRSSLYRQAGNALTVPLAYQIAREIEKSIRDPK
jgi:DNA (cytosine-5)-methyltransferase 1